MDSINTDEMFNSSAQSTPRSSISNASGSLRSSGSGSNQSVSSNYSLKQRRLKISPDIKRVDVAMLENPLVKSQLQQQLTAVDNNILSGDFADISVPNKVLLPDHIENVHKELEPRPPAFAKPRNSRRRSTQHSTDSQSASDLDTKSRSNDNIKVMDKNGGGSLSSSRESLNTNSFDQVNMSKDKEAKNIPLENKGNKERSINDWPPSKVSNIVKKHHDDALSNILRDNLNKRREVLLRRKSEELSKTPNQEVMGCKINGEDDDTMNSKSSDPEDACLTKSNESSILINSYENYLRRLSKSEEDASEVDDSNEETDDILADSSGSSSDSSGSSVSVSSLSDNADDDDDDDDDHLSHDDENTLKFQSNGEENPASFEPLYSLPTKDKKNSNFLKPIVNDENPLFNSSMLSDTSQHKYFILNESHQDGELKTQSVPDLRTGRSFRTFDTMGYMCPKINDNAPQIVSSPDVKQQNLNLKYRPLPDIPICNTQKKDAEYEETIYERIGTQDLSSSAPHRPKISFKAVASRVVSLMPRLTTKEARNREADRYMADIIQYLPDQRLRVYCGTWNMKGIKVMPESLEDYILPHESFFIQDIYAIGCQEGTPFRKEWEIRLQETLGPTHVLMYSGNFGVLHLSIFVRRELVWFCTGIEQDTVATRIAHKFKTKGAIAVCFNLFGTSLLFINSHFASNEEKLKERVNDYRTIIKSLNIPFGEDTSGQTDVTSRFDRVFWFGDFNFRVNKKRAEADKVFAKRGFSDQEERKKMIITELMHHDQLSRLLEKGKIFHGFHEATVNFLPTYKFDVNTDTYDTSPKARVPSWTDRILYKSKHPDDIKVALYNSCTTIKCSDHRPVFCIMETKIEPNKKSVQLPGAMFDRDIYIEANMRRSAPKGNQHASNVCVIL